MTTPRSGEFSDAPGRLLIVDRESGRGLMLVAEVAGCLAVPPVVTEAPNGRQAIEALRLGAFDIIMLDLGSLDDLAPSPEEAVGRVVKVSQGALTVAVSDGGSVSAAVAVMRAGAHEMLARPFSPGGLAPQVARLAQRHGKAHFLAAEAALPELLAELSGASAQMQAIGNLLGAPADSRQLQALVRRLAAALEPGPTMAESAAMLPRPAVEPMWQQEQRIIEDAIASFAGNVALAAAALELSPSTIYRKRQAWAEMEARRGAA